MCKHCALLGRALRRRGRKEPLHDVHMLWPFAPGNLVDATATAFLRETLAAAGCGLLAITVSGDGNCLAHSVSRAV